MEDFTPRAYQIDLYEKALSGNTLIYLPTGAGKTYIAVMLIKALSKDVRLPLSKGGKRTFFAVNTVPLASQQSDYISRHTDLSCKGLTGEITDELSSAEWKTVLEENQVLVMTSQVIVDILSHGIISLQQINLIIFDECHRAVKDHPMRQIMRLFEKIPENEQPKILGLTATLLNSNVKTGRVEDIVHNLEITYNAKVISVDSTISVIGHERVTENFIEFVEPKSTKIVEEVEKILDHMEKILGAGCWDDNPMNPETSKIFQPKTRSRKLNGIVLETKQYMKTQGIYAASKSVLLNMIKLIKVSKTITEKKVLSLFNFLINEMTVIRKILEQEMDSKNPSSEYEKITENSSDQLLRLFGLIKKFYDEAKNKEEFCFIIFVTRRQSAQVLYHVLQNLSSSSEKFKFLRPDYVVGYSNNPYKNAAENLCISKWNTEALIRFRQGASNCLIATDVVDEGVDIPLCSLVVRYDPPNDFRSYVQSKGRARHSKSHFTLFISKNDTVLRNNYSQWVEIERILKGYLNYEQRVEPLPMELVNCLYSTEIKPYSVMGPNGVKSTISDISAIELINRYCSSLGGSKFCIVTPTYKLDKVKTVNEEQDCYRVNLKFPLASPVREIIKGDVMATIIMAKRSAAMKACILLHEKGELTDDLLPRKPEHILANISTYLDNWRNETNENKGVIGTYTFTRSHRLVQPESFYAARPTPNSQAYLHILEAKPTHFSPPTDNRQRVFYDYLMNESGFAILSTKKLPALPSFPIYMNIGELRVNVRVNHSKVTLSSDEIGKLCKFHWIVFSEISEIVKGFLTFDDENLDNSYLVVPVDKTSKINWEIVEKYKEIVSVPASQYGTLASPDESSSLSSTEICESSSENSPKLFQNIAESDWQIVKPQYRSSQEVYIVTQVCHEMNPLSLFPTDMPNYFEYYKEKHKVMATDMKQPLLEVKPVSRHINFIVPRRSPEDIKKRKSENHEEHFIPELCNIIIFSAMYWLKATTLPSILHRVTQLLVAEELRRKIVQETGLGKLEVEQWPDIEFIQNEQIQSHMEQQKKNFDNDDSDSNSSIDMDIDLDSFDFSNGEVITNELPRVDASVQTEVDIYSLESNDVPWPKEREPRDLCRGMEKIQMIDVEYYHQFTTQNDFIRNLDLKPKVMYGHYSSKPKVDAPILRAINIASGPSIGPGPADIMYALTTKMCADFFNLERMETLGDSFLKYIASAHLYEEFFHYGEGQLTICKGQIIGNRNLYYCGEAKNIPGRLKIDQFVPNGNFVTPSYSVPKKIRNILLNEEIAASVLHELTIPKNEQFSGRLSEDVELYNLTKVKNWPEKRDDLGKSGIDNFIGFQIVKDKCVSDSVEALSGTYLSFMGLYGVTKLLKWFGVVPNNLNIPQILSGLPPNPRLGEGNPIDHMPWIDFIQSALDYKFKDPVYLLQAFTHASFTGHSITTDYQRLEFLGDAVIDFLITLYIFENAGNLSPGEMTDLRSALVNNITFACLTVKYGLHTAILQYSPDVYEAIEKFVKFQKERNFAVNDELLRILYEEDECNIAEYVEVPKVLADIFEAVIGAIYLDTGKDLHKTWEILYGLMREEIETFKDDVPLHPVRRIFETTSVNPKFLKAEVLAEENRTMVPLRIHINGKPKFFHGFGMTKTQAKCAAAKQALKFLARKKFHFR